MSTRRTFIKSVTAAGSIGLAGCTGGTETVEFHFVSATPDEKTQEALTKAVEAWGKQRDEEIDPRMEFVGVIDASPTLEQYLATGTPPHLVMGNAPLARFHDDLVDVSRINQEVLGLDDPAWGGQVGDKQVVVPDHIIVNAMWYRKDIYEEAGVEPATTWEEHRQVLNTLGDHLGDDMQPELAMANPETTATYLYTCTEESTMGIDYIERTGPALEDVRVSLSDEEQRSKAIDFLDHHKWVYQNHSPESVSYNFGNMISVLLEEQVATTTYSGRVVNNALDLSPDMVQNIGVANRPIPGDIDPSEYKTPGVMQTQVVPDTERSDMALDFLEFYFGSDYYFDRLLGAGTNSVPLRTEWLEDDRLQNHETWSSPAGQEYYQWLQDNWDALFTGQYGRTDPPSTYWPAVVNDTRIGPAMVSNGVTGRMTPEEAVNDAVSKLEEELPGVLDTYTS